MSTITSIITSINNFVWGPPMLALILGTGLFLQLRRHVGSGGPLPAAG